MRPTHNIKTSEINARRKMENTIRAEIFGDAELWALFNQLSLSQQKSVIIAGYRKAAKPLVAQIKVNIRTMLKRRSGNLEKSIGVKPHRNLPILYVGPRTYGNFKGYHAHLVESGTRERRRKVKELQAYGAAKGRGEATGRTGKVEPTYFFARAYNVSKEKVAESFKYDRIKAFHDYVQRYNNRKKT